MQPRAVTPPTTYRVNGRALPQLLTVSVSWSHSSSIACNRKLGQQRKQDSNPLTDILPLKNHRPPPSRYCNSTEHKQVLLFLLHQQKKYEDSQWLSALWHTRYEYVGSKIILVAIQRRSVGRCSFAKVHRNTEHKYV